MTAETLLGMSGTRCLDLTFSNSLILTPTGFRRTESLSSNSLIAENEQPVWDMVRWANPAPRTLREQGYEQGLMPAEYVKPYEPEE